MTGMCPHSDVISPAHHLLIMKKLLLHRLSQVAILTARTTTFIFCLTGLVF